MKIRHRIVLALIAGISLQLCLLPNSSAQTASPADGPAHHGHAGHGDATADAESDAEWSEGEVRRVDLAAGKLTLKHGEIRSIDMPPMTMVFGLQDGAVPAATLSALKPGDKLRFKAARIGGKLLVTAIER